MKVILALLVMIFSVSSQSFVLASDSSTESSPSEAASLKDQLFALAKKKSLTPAEQTTLQELLSSVDPNETDGRGASPLLWAIAMGSIEAIEILLRSRDINVNHAAPSTKNTALHQAMVRGGLPLRMLLLRDDVNINTQNNDGYTPLHLATHKGLIDSIKILLSLQGAAINLSIIDNSGATALGLARREGKEDILELLESFAALLARLNAPIVELPEGPGNCDICLTDDTTLKTLSCGHQFCGACLKAHVKEKYRTERDLFDMIPCPDPSCTTHLTRNEIGAIMAPKGNKYLETYKKIVIAKTFQATVTEAALHHEVQALIAAGLATRHNDCGAVVMKDAGCNYVSCRCGVKFCYSCGSSTTTPGHDCKAYRRRMVTTTTVEVE